MSSNRVLVLVLYRMMLVVITPRHCQSGPSFVFNRGPGAVGWWLVNVAVSEVSIMRMRACGQLANNINPIHALFRFHGSNERSY